MSLPDYYFGDLRFTNDNRKPREFFENLQRGIKHNDARAINNAPYTKRETFDRVRA